MGNGFKLLLKINFERYWQINLSLASWKCKCSVSGCGYKSRQNRSRIESGFGAESSSCKFPWLMLSFKVDLNTTTGLLFPFRFSTMPQNWVSKRSILGSSPSFWKVTEVIPVSWLCSYLVTFRLLSHKYRHFRVWYWSLWDIFELAHVSIVFPHTLVHL